MIDEFTMNTSNISFLILSFLTLLIGGIWLFLYLRRKRHNASFPVRIKEIKTQKQRDGEYLYVDLELRNLTGKDVGVIEIQQRHMKGPFELFILQDASGRTRKSLYEAREQFNKPLKIKYQETLIKNYRMKILPPMKGKKLYFEYRVLTTERKGYVSDSRWFELI